VRDDVLALSAGVLRKGVDLFHLREGDPGAGIVVRPAVVNTDRAARDGSAKGRLARGR
jgi:hypothetical protein